MAHPNTHTSQKSPPGARRPRGRRAGRLTVATLAGAAIMIPGAMVDTAPAHAAEPFDCSTIYAINANSGNGSTLWSLDAISGAQTTIGTIDEGADPTSLFNGLGVAVTPEHPDGAAFAMRWDPWTTNDAGALATFDFATSTTTTSPVVRMPAGWGATQTHGAYDPHSRLFFHGAATGGQLHLEARDPSTGDRQGRMAISFSAAPAPGSNGDIAFDRDGNLYIVMSSANDAAIYSVDVHDIALASSAPYPTVRATRIQSFRVDDTDGLGVNGIAFGSDGHLVVSTGLELLRVNPMSGAVTSHVTFTEPGIVDIASCSSPSRLTLQKDFPEGRHSEDPADQVRLSISGAGLADLSVTTTGTSPGVQQRRLTLPVLPGATIEIEETGAGAEQDRYRSSWNCVDDASGAILASGDGTRGSLTVPRVADGVGLLCTFVNSPRGDGEITLTKTADVAEARQGDTVTYSFEITNTGTSPLSDVTVEEVAFSGSGSTPEVTCPSQPLSLAVAETVVCSATYTVLQADVDRGSVENTATATGTTPDTGRITSPPSQVVVSTPGAPGLAIVKSTDAEAFWSGSVIDYTFVVTNTGELTMTDVRVDETAFSGAGQVPEVTCPPDAAALAPGESMTCTASYTVEDADLAAAKIDNAAIAVGQTSGTTVESSPSEATVPRGTGEVSPEETGEAKTPPAEETPSAEKEITTEALAHTGNDLTFAVVAAAVATAMALLGAALAVARRRAAAVTD